MTPQIEKKQNLLFGSCYLLVGGLAWALAVYFAVVPRVPRPAPVVVNKVSSPACQSALTTLGYSVVTQDSQVVAYEPLSEAPQLQLEKASLAPLACRAPLSAFCMGEACERPGLTVTLKLTP